MEGPSTRKRLGDGQEGGARLAGPVETRGLGVASLPPGHSWASGALSSFLDNEPTYLASAPSGSLGTDAADLGQLLRSERGAALLAAISMGSILMGANTYIRNGPNFMVKAIAGQDEVRMPGFFGYMAYSGVILLPLFVVLTWAFLL